MQKMSLARQCDELTPATSAIRVVTHDGMTHGGKMYANLVCPAGVEMSAQEVHGVEPREPHEIRSRRSPCTDDCHALSVSRIPGDRLIHRKALVVQVAPGERGVAAHD